MAVSVWLEQLVLIPSTGASDWEMLASSPGINEALLAQYKSRLATIGDGQNVRFFLPLGFGAVIGQKIGGEKPFLHAIILSEVAWREVLNTPEVLFTPDVFLTELPADLPSELPRIDLDMCRELWLGPGDSTLPDAAMEAIMEAALRGPLFMAVQGDDENTRLAAMNHLFRTLPAAMRKELWWVLAHEDPHADQVYIRCLSVAAVEAEAAKAAAPSIIATGDDVYGFGFTPVDQIDPYVKLLAKGMPDAKREFIEAQQELSKADPAGGYTMPAFWARMYDVLHDAAALSLEDFELWSAWVQSAPDRGLEEEIHRDLAGRFLALKPDIESRLELLQQLESRNEPVALRYGLSALNGMCESISVEELGDIKRALKPENRAWIQKVQSAANPRLEKLWEKDPEPIEELMERMRQAGAQTDPFLEAAELWLDRPVTDEQKDAISHWAYECMHTRLFMSKQKAERMRELLTRVENLQSADLRATALDALWRAYGDVLRTGLNTEDVASLVKHRELTASVPELLEIIEQEIRWRVASMPWDTLKPALERGRGAYDDEIWGLLKARTWLVLKTEPISHIKSGVSWLRDQGLIEPYIEDIGQDDRWATISEGLGREWTAKVAMARLKQEWGDRGRLEKFHEQAESLQVMGGALQHAFNDSYRPTLRIQEIDSIDDALSCAEHIHWFCADDESLLSECRRTLPDLVRDWYDAQVDDWESPADALDELEELCVTLRRARLIDDEVQGLLDECVAIAMDAASLHRLPDLMDVSWQVSRMIGLNGRSGEELLARVPDIIDNVLEGPDWPAARSLQRTLESALAFCRDEREEDFEVFVAECTAVWCRKVGVAFENGTSAEDVLNATLALDGFAGERRLNGEALVPTAKMGDNGVALLVRMRRNADEVVELQPAQLARLQKLILLVLPEWDSALRIHDPQGWLERYGGLFVAWLSPNGRNESQQALEPIFVSLFGTRGIDMCRQYVRYAQPGSFLSDLGWNIRNLFGGKRVADGAAPAARGNGNGATQRSSRGVQYAQSASGGTPSWMPMVLGGAGVVLTALLVIFIVQRVKGSGEIIINAPLANGGVTATDSLSNVPPTQAPTEAPATPQPEEPSNPAGTGEPGGAESAVGGDATQAPEGAGDDNSTKVYPQKNVNIRKEPNTSADILATVKLGTELKLITDAENGWVKVSYDGSEGYVSAELLAFSTKKPATAPPLYTPPPRKTENRTATPKPTSQRTKAPTDKPSDTPAATNPPTNVPQDTPHGGETAAPATQQPEPRATLVPYIPPEEE